MGIITRTFVVVFALLFVYQAAGAPPISVTLSSTDLQWRDQCCFPAINKNIAINGLVSGLAARASGGCSSLTVALTGCTSNSTTFQSSQCTYNSASDVLTFNGALGVGEGARFYFIRYSVSDSCGDILTLHTSTVFYASEGNAPSSGCIDVSGLYF